MATALAMVEMRSELCTNQNNTYMMTYAVSNTLYIIVIALLLINNTPVFILTIRSIMFMHTFYSCFIVTYANVNYVLLHALIMFFCMH